MEKRRREQESTNPAEVKEKEILTAEELAVVLGCGRTTAYALLRDGEIPSFYVGRLRRVRRQDVDTYIDIRLKEAQKW